MQRVFQILLISLLLSSCSVINPYVESQGTAIADLEGTVEILPEFSEGLRDIEGFSHLILLFHFHLVKEYRLVARPFMDDTPRGVFSIRGPRRPNPIGMTVVRLLGREGCVLRIAGVDMVNGTPLLDIKPYFPDIDAHHDVKTGWAKDKFRKEGRSKHADNRFVEP